MSVRRLGNRSVGLAKGVGQLGKVARIPVADDRFECDGIRKLRARNVDPKQSRKETAVLGDHRTHQGTSLVYQLERVNKLLPKPVELRQYAIDRANCAPDGIEQAPNRVVNQGDNSRCSGYHRTDAELSFRRRSDHRERYCTNECQSHDPTHTRYQEEREQVGKQEAQ